MSTKMRRFMRNDEPDDFFLERPELEEPLLLPLFLSVEASKEYVDTERMSCTSETPPVKAVSPIKPDSGSLTFETLKHSFQ